MSATPTTNRFRELYKLSLADYPTYSELYARYLDAGLALLDMDIGIVSHIEDNSLYTILAVKPIDTGFVSGDSMPLGDTYCAQVVAQETTVAVANVAANHTLSRHPAYLEHKLAAYIAAPIIVRGRIYGTVNFSSPNARTESFSEEDIELIELMASTLGRTLESDELEQQSQDANRAMRENAELFGAAFDYAPIGMAIVGLDGKWLRVNKALCEIIGYSEPELLELDFQAITHPGDIDTDLGLLNETLERKRDSYRIEKRYYHKNGRIVWVQLSVALVCDEGNEPVHFVSQIQDISQHKYMVEELQKNRQELEVANQKLSKLASKDALTRVHNRRAFDSSLKREIEHCRQTRLSLSLLMLDMDHFKDYNDAFGHPAGDIVLQKTADVLLSVARDNDFVARYGGEEFAVILPNTDVASSIIVAERIRSGIEAMTGLRKRITASIGVATIEPRRGLNDLPSANEIIDSADAALYRAKRAGRNRVFHSQQSLNNTESSDKV